MRTFATLIGADTCAGSPETSILVGRMVANTAFLQAVLRHGGFEEAHFFVGEERDRATAEAVGAAAKTTTKVRVRRLVELAGAFAAGEISIFHNPSHTDVYLDVAWLRSRCAAGTVPVTGQIHSLSYPALMTSYLRYFLLPPEASDAIFCSSQAGRVALEKCLAAVAQTLAAQGMAAPMPLCELPVVPLGVDTQAVRGGNRQAFRKARGIPESAFVVLCLGRFTEYDKMDLFPLVQAFQAVVRRVSQPNRPLYLLLAGARQGTRTPEMLGLWANGLGIGDRVHAIVNFAEGEKKDLLRAADLFVSPCDNPQETFGLSVVEAMAAGLPVVVSDFDGYKDTVNDEVGIRVPTRFAANLADISDLGAILFERPLHLMLGQSIEVDLAALEDGICALYLDGVRRERLGREAARRAAALYDWRAVIRQYTEVWQRLSEKPPGPRALKRHPLAMDFDSIFGHYASKTSDEQRRVVRTPFAEAICQGENHYPVYPEVAHLVSGEGVVAALSLAAQPLVLGQLLSELELRLDRPRWQVGYLAAWLLKHGLLADAPGC